MNKKILHPIVCNIINMMLQPLITHEENRFDRTIIVFVFALVYLSLQIGDFYYVATLSKPYQTYEVLHFSTKMWLLANGCMGIYTTIYCLLYIYNNYIRENAAFVAHVLVITGLGWTIFGYFFLNFTYTVLYNYNVFIWYLIFKLSIQSIIYVMSFCVMCKCTF
jgi:hypothetical protein